ncbi:hypothetical protein TNCV_2810891 [Trichonephila clavipes]|nr:hypothetical protein TNCV_2810891 [Trichonephila clavipes]
MNARFSEEVYLQQTVEENGWARKRAIWTMLSDSDLPNFPRLTWKDLQYLTLGIYQLKQSRSYDHEQLNQWALRKSRRFHCCSTPIEITTHKVKSI